MRQKAKTRGRASEKLVKDIRRATRKQYSAEEKIRIVLDGLRGEETIAELCRREGIAQGLYYNWSKEYLEAGKRDCSCRSVTRRESGCITKTHRSSACVPDTPTTSGASTSCMTSSPG